MEPKRNNRGIPYGEKGKQHLKLKDLKEIPGLRNQYLSKNDIPPYPHPEFHVSRVNHDTDSKGLHGIREDEGFKHPGKDGLVWWSLDVGPEEIASAEKRLLETTYPDRTEEQAQRQESFLGMFATSPAFKRPSSLGSYRFTFNLEEVLKAYSEQFCSGEPPVMRVYATHLYEQNMVYIVLVHGPAGQEKFSEYPLLHDGPNAVCAYKDGCFIWRSEAMCETHNYELVLRSDEKQMAAVPMGVPEFYLWDIVAFILHVDDKVLRFEAGRLRENLKFFKEETVNCN